MSIEAMKQALEAWEKAIATCFDENNNHQLMIRPIHFVNQSITSLRQAIAEAEKQERFFCERCGKRLSGGIHTCTPPAEAKLEEKNT